MRLTIIMRLTMGMSVRWGPYQLPGYLHLTSTTLNS